MIVSIGIVGFDNIIANKQDLIEIVGNGVEGLLKLYLSEDPFEVLCLAWILLFMRIILLVLSCWKKDRVFINQQGLIENRTTHPKPILLWPLAWSRWDYLV
jgi:hypothetical protein